MNASLIEEFHRQFQRLVDDMKQSVGKELEKKATELYTLFLYHLSAAYNPSYSSVGLLQMHPLPSSLASPLTSPLAPGPGVRHLDLAVRPRGLGHLNHSHLNAIISPRNNLPPQSTFFFRAPPMSVNHSGQNNVVNYADNAAVVAAGNPETPFHPVPGPPVMMELTETAQNSARHPNVLSHQHPQQQQQQHHLQQLQQQHQSLGAISKATSSLVNGQLPLHHQQQQKLQQQSQHVSVIAKPSIPTSEHTTTAVANAAAFPLKPQAQKAPLTLPFVDFVSSDVNGLPPSSSLSSMVAVQQPKVATPVVQNSKPQQAVPSGPILSPNEKVVQPFTSITTTIETPTKSSSPLPSSSPPPPPQQSQPLKTSSIPETVKEVTTIGSTSSKQLLSHSSPSINEKVKFTLLKDTTAKSLEPMDLSRTSPISSKVQNNKKDTINERKNESYDDDINKNKKCDCVKCNDTENQNKENDDIYENENDEDDENDDEDEDSSENENEDENEYENDENENNEEELEDENVQVDSDDNDSFFLDEIKKSNELKRVKTKENQIKINANNVNLAFNQTNNNIPEKRLKTNRLNLNDQLNEKSNNKNCNRTLSLQSQSFFYTYRKNTLRRSFSLDLSITGNNSNYYFQNQSPKFSSLSPPAISSFKLPQFSENAKNNNDSNKNANHNKNITPIVNGGSKRKLESILPQLPLLPSTSPTDASLPATDNKVRHFKTLSVKCLLDDCPATFQKLEELDEHLIQHHCILPHRCVMQGCSLSFSSTYELGRHYRVDHQGDGIKVWQCSKCGMKSKGNHYLLKHMYNYHYEGIFKCAKPDCSYQAKFRQSVVNHYRRHHLPVPERFEANARLKSKAQMTQQCPLEGCLVTIRSGELPLRRHLDQVHNSFGFQNNHHNNFQVPNRQHSDQQQLFFRLPDSPATVSAASPSTTFFPAHQSSFIFTEEQQQRELAIASAAVAAAASNSTIPSKYASERNATAYSIISVNCTAESNCPVAAQRPPMRSIEELERHLQTVHGILPFRCYLCTLSFSQVRDLDVHLLEAHLGQIEWPCPRCDHKRKSHHALANHVLKFHHSGAFACPATGCGHISGLRIEAIRHFNRLHCEYACKVDGCGLIFKAKECLRAHEAADHAVGNGSATGSDAGTDGGGSDHQQNSNQFICNTCGKPFSTKGNLKTHQRIHLGVKPFRCRFTGCGKAFRAKEHLTIHERTHSGIKPYRCTWPECGHQTTDRSSMIAHVRGFHFRLPYKLKEQKERNIVDDRDPRQFVEVLPELLKYESFIHVLTG